MKTVKALSLWTHIINYSLFGVFYDRMFVATFGPVGPQEQTSSDTLIS